MSSYHIVTADYSTNTSTESKKMKYLWYAAYGSNLLPKRFGEYIDLLPTDPSFPSYEWRLGKGNIYFAGTSTRWKSGVAFVDIKGDAMLLYRIYRLSYRQLLRVWEGENQLSIKDGIGLVSSLATKETGEIEKAKFSGNCDSSKGKYDAAVVLGYKEKESIITLTTSRDLPIRQPADSYILAITEGLKDSPLSSEELATYISMLKFQGCTS